MQLPITETRLTILIDCTTHNELRNFTGVETISCTAVSAQDAVYEWFRKLTETDFDKTVLALHSSQEIMAVCCILANSVVTHKLEDIPHLCISDVSVYEVWDNENISVMTEPGFLRVSSYDEAMKPIISDWIKLQAANASQDENAEVIQYTEEVAVEPEKTVQDVLRERKERQSEIENRVKESKEHETTSNQD